MTTWKTQTDGKIEQVFDVSQEVGEPALLFTTHPDWVRLPPELGGEQTRVKAMLEEANDCPICGTGGIKQILLLEVPYGVVACPACRQFGWFRR